MLRKHGPKVILMCMMCVKSGTMTMVTVRPVVEMLVLQRQLCVIAVMRVPTPYPLTKDTLRVTVLYPPGVGAARRGSSLSAPGPLRPSDFDATDLQEGRPLECAIPAVRRPMLDHIHMRFVTFRRTGWSARAARRSIMTHVVVAAAPLIRNRLVTTRVRESRLFIVVETRTRFMMEIS